MPAIVPPAIVPPAIVPPAIVPPAINLPTMVALLCAALAMVAADTVQAQAVALKFSDRNYLQVTLSGRRHITCKSKYHNVNMKVPFTSSFLLNSSQLNLLEPGVQVKPGDTWVADAFAVSFSQLLHSHTEYQPKSPTGYDRWIGSSLREEDWRPSGQMQVRFEKNQGSQAVFHLSGWLGGLDTGKMGSRYGPNTWRKTSTVKFNSTLTIETATGKVVDFSLEGKGDVDGAYYTSSTSTPDKFTAEILLKTTRFESLDGDNLDKAFQLISRLGDTDYHTREKASRALEAMGPSIRMLLIDARQNNPDLEIKFRAARVLATFPAVQAQPQADETAKPPEDDF